MFNRNVADAAAPFFNARLSFRSRCASGAESVRAALSTIAAWRRRRREHRELLEFLASDHRAAADIGYRHRRP